MTKRSKSVPNGYVKLMQACWSQDPKKRPPFNEVFHSIRDMHLEEVRKDVRKRLEQKSRDELEGDSDAFTATTTKSDGGGVSLSKTKGMSKKVRRVASMTNVDAPEPPSHKRSSSSSMARSFRSLMSFTGRTRRRPSYRKPDGGSSPASPMRDGLELGALSSIPEAESGLSGGGR